MTRKQRGRLLGRRERSEIAERLIGTEQIGTDPKRTGRARCGEVFLIGLRQTKRRDCSKDAAELRQHDLQRSTDGGGVLRKNHR